MNALNSEPLLLQLQHLIIHQSDEWTDHESRPASCQSRQLVTERLARAGRHDKQRVFPRRHRLTDGFLIGPEFREAECVLQQLGETCAVGHNLWAWQIRSIGDLRCGGNRRRWLHGRSLTNFSDDGTDVLTDAIEEWLQLAFTVLDLLEKCLPLAGHRRTLDFGMNHLN